MWEQRRHRCALAAGMLAASLCGRSTCAAAQTHPKHILFLMIDDLGYNDVSYRTISGKSSIRSRLLSVSLCLSRSLARSLARSSSRFMHALAWAGNTSDLSSPNIDRLALAGLRLERCPLTPLDFSSFAVQCWNPAPFWLLFSKGSVWDRLFADSLSLYLSLSLRYYTHNLCSPSRTSFLSGRYASTLSMQGCVIINGHAIDLPKEVSTVADRLSAGGWKTAAFGKWVSCCASSLSLSLSPPRPPPAPPHTHKLSQTCAITGCALCNCILCRC